MNGPIRPDVLCCPFNEFGGLRVWDYSQQWNYGGAAGNIATITGTTLGRAIHRDGSYWSHQSTDDRVAWNTSGSGSGQLLMPTTACTVMVGKIKRDSTNRASTLFGMENTSGVSGRLGSHCPYSDGVVYWDWENTTTGRLSVAGLTFGDDVWAFTAGARGQEIWQNGILRASNANTGGRAQVGGNTFNLGYGNGLTTTTSDLVDHNFIFLWAKQLPQAVIQQLSYLPFSIFEAFRPRVFGIPAPVAPFVPYVETMPQLIPGG